MPKPMNGSCFQPKLFFGLHGIKNKVAHACKTKRWNTKPMCFMSWHRRQGSGDKAKQGGPSHKLSKAHL